MLPKKGTAKALAVASGAILAMFTVAACSSGSNSSAPTLNATFVQTISKYGPAKGQVLYPMGIASTGKEVIVTDTPSSRVQVFTPTGQVTQSWGTFGKNLGQMWTPQGVALDAQGNVYVADSGNSRIQEFNPKGAPLRTLGVEGNSPNGLSHPVGVAVAPDGTMFIADSGNSRVQKVAPDGTFDGRFAAAQAGIKWQHPSGITLDPSGNVWVTDAVANRVFKLAPDGRLLTQWGEAGTDPGKMNSPQGLAVDSGGRVYLADTANNRIDVFTSSGTFLGMWDGQGPQAPNAPSVPAAVAIVESGSTVKTYICNSNGTNVLVVDVRW